MKKYITLLFLIGSTTLSAIGQTNIESVLQQVESNNIQLKANSQLLKADKWEAKSTNNLENPNVSYSKVWDSKDHKETDIEMSVTQAFDFPSTYFSRRKANNARLKGMEAYYNSQRQSILLVAKELCLDIIKLNQEKQILQERMQYAQQLLNAYNTMIRSGNATKMDFNKIKLDVLNQRTEFTMVSNELKKKEAELTVLNGNIEIELTTLNNYGDKMVLPNYGEVINEITELNPDIQQVKYEYNSALKQVAVHKAGWLPGFDLGYKRTSGPGRHSNGLLVGVSVPLFNNRGKVTMAKATAISKLYEQDIVKNQVLSDSYQAYQEAETLASQIADYEGLIDIEESLRILKLALEGGELSVTEYFVEIGIMYQSAQNYIELTSLYHKQIAKLFKHRL